MKKTKITKYKKNIFVIEKYSNIVVVTKWSKILKKYKGMMWKFILGHEFDGSDKTMNYLKKKHSLLVGGKV